MKISFKKLIQELNEEHPEQRMTQRKLASEMYEQGVMGSWISAVNIMQYHSSGKAKSVDYEMLLFLEKRFNKTFDELVER